LQDGEYTTNEISHGFLEEGNSLAQQLMMPPQRPLQEIEEEKEVTWNDERSELIRE